MENEDAMFHYSDDHTPWVGWMGSYGLGLGDFFSFGSPNGYFLGANTADWHQRSIFAPLLHRDL